MTPAEENTYISAKLTHLKQQLRTVLGRPISMTVIVWPAGAGGVLVQDAHVMTDHPDIRQHLLAVYDHIEKVESGRGGGVRL